MNRVNSEVALSTAVVTVAGVSGTWILDVVASEKKGAKARIAYSKVCNCVIALKLRDTGLKCAFALNVLAC